MRARDYLSDAYQGRAKVFDKVNAVSPWHKLYREYTWDALERILPPAGALVLDAGGGTGIFAEVLARKGYRVVVYDALFHMLAIAKTKARQSFPDYGELALACGDLERLSLQDSVFDIIICTQVLNFCPDLAPVFHEFSRLLKPGGRVFADIDTAYRWCVIEALSKHLDNALSIIRNGCDESRNIVGADYHFVPRSDLVNIISSAGLEVESMWGLLFVAPYIHVFANSAEFLSPNSLPEQAQLFCEPKEMQKLRQLEKDLSRIMPIDGAGWIQFNAIKPKADPTNLDGQIR